MKIRVRVRGMVQWKDRFADAQRDAPRELRQVVSKGALNVKTQWAARWAGNRHAPHISRSISYDLSSTGSSWHAEIGPDKTRTQGPLGTILEDANGMARNRATHAGQRAGRAEEPRFVNAVARAGEKGAGG